jgi:GxxExxY protein
MGIVERAIPLKYKEITYGILSAGSEVHRRLGPGLVESAYGTCLEIALRIRHIPFLREVAVAIDYKGTSIENAFRADFIVDGKVVVEIKSVSSFDKVHEAQVLTYLKLTGLEVGLLLNFNVPALRQGIRRLVRAHPAIPVLVPPELRVIS